MEVQGRSVVGSVYVAGSSSSDGLVLAGDGGAGCPGGRA